MGNGTRTIPPSFSKTNTPGETLHDYINREWNCRDCKHLESESHNQGECPILDSMTFTNGEGQGVKLNFGCKFFERKDK